ncbi:hypothetical protein VQ643_03625 [Pseudomonas sp. F1_0610]|uniref:hypothetical protein n=1 Tax=Pseudomonas sp. F1_0610 TaxID=3114284 RepID=UPI0039C0AE41
MPASLKFTFLAQWWGFLLLYAVPVTAVLLLGESFEMPYWFVLSIFILGLLSLFANLKGFHRFKHCVIAMGKNDSTVLDEQWDDLHQARRRAFIVAGFPAWIGTLGYIFGLEGVAVLLLLLGSLLQLMLYRIPLQLK